MTDTLFPMPPPERTRLEIAMEKHVIHTHDSHSPHTREFPRWLAVLMPPCWQMGYGAKEGMDIPDLIARVGRLINEGGYSGYGATEEEAVLDVCRNNGIHIVL